jgi:hypothetical protein
MSEGSKHPADEWAEDSAADRFYGERTWNVLEREPFTSFEPEKQAPFPLGVSWTAPDSDRRAQPSKSGTLARADRGFWVLALGGLIGGLLAHRLGGWVLLLPGVLVGMVVASRWRRG